MGELLVEARVASQADVDAALADQSAGEPSRLGEILLAQGKLTPLGLAQALAAQLSLPFTDLAYVAPEASDLVPLEFQRAHKIVPFRVDEENGARRVHVAIADPTLNEVIDELKAQLKLVVVVHVASLEDVEAVHSALGGDVVAGALIEGSVIDDVEVDLSAGLPPAAPDKDLFGSSLLDLPAEQPQPPFAALDNDPFGTFGPPDLPQSLETTVPMTIGELPPHRRAAVPQPAASLDHDPLAAYDTLLAEPAPVEPQTLDPVFDLPLSAETPIDVSSFDAEVPGAADQAALAAVADDASAIDGILVDAEPDHDPVTAIGVSPALVAATVPEPEFERVTAIKFSPALVAASAKAPETHPTEADLFGDLEPVSAEPLTADLAEVIGSSAAPAPAPVPGLLESLKPVAPIMPPLPKVAMSPPPPVVPKHNAIPSFAILPDDPLMPDLQPSARQPPPPPPAPKMSPREPNSSPSVVARIALKRVAVVQPADGGPARTVEIPRAAIVDSAEKAKAEFAAAERALEAAALRAEAEQAERARVKAEAAAAEQARAQAAAEKARLDTAERERAELERAEKERAEAAAKAEAEAAEAKAREEREAKAREEEETKVRQQAEAKARADAEFERLKAEAAAKAKARSQEQAAARAKAKAEAEAAEKAKAEADAARIAEEERQKAEAEAARLAEEERQKAEAEAAARAESEAAQAKAEAEIAQARAEAAAAEAAATLLAEATPIEAPTEAPVEPPVEPPLEPPVIEPVPDDLGSADTAQRPAELPTTLETTIPIPPEAFPSAAAGASEPVTDNFVLPDWMKVPASAPPAYVDPKATTTAGLKRLLDQIETASPLEQGRMLAALVKLLVERGLLDVKEVIAALNKP